MELNKLNMMKSMLALILAFSLNACNTNSIQNDNDEVNDTSSIKQQWSGKAINNTLSIKDNRLDAIYQHYSKLTSALIDGKAGEAKIESNAIEAGAEQLKNGSLLAKFAQTITSASTMEAQRFAYSKLSTELISMLKTAGVSKGSLYVNFCPMAFNDEGAFWVSDYKQIKNPYLGPQMINCGRVKETISND
jgi:hypothetical protein